jgi:hypothetical protein
VIISPPNMEVQKLKNIFPKVLADVEPCPHFCPPRIIG